MTTTPTASRHQLESAAVGLAAHALRSDLGSFADDLVAELKMTFNDTNGNPASFLFEVKFPDRTRTVRFWVNGSSSDLIDGVVWVAGHRFTISKKTWLTRREIRHFELTAAQAAKHLSR